MAFSRPIESGCLRWRQQRLPAAMPGGLTLGLLPPFLGLLSSSGVTSDLNWKETRTVVQLSLDFIPRRSRCETDSVCLDAETLWGAYTQPTTWLLNSGLGEGRESPAWSRMLVFFCFHCGACIRLRKTFTKGNGRLLHHQGPSAYQEHGPCMPLDPLVLGSIWPQIQCSFWDQSAKSRKRGAPAAPSG